MRLGGAVWLLRCMEVLAREKLTINGHLLKWSSSHLLTWSSSHMHYMHFQTTAKHKWYGEVAAVGCNIGRPTIEQMLIEGISLTNSHTLLSYTYQAFPKSPAPSRSRISNVSKTYLKRIQNVSQTYLKRI